MEFYTVYHSPIGILTLTSHQGKLTGIWYEGSKFMPKNLTRQDDLPVFNSVRTWLDDYFAGKKPEAAGLPLSPSGTEFQKLVWSMLLQIPYGKFTTYGALAKEAALTLGKERMSAQAIGNAVGRNPISIIIPCHRVLGIDGTLTGYAGGLDRKRFLLDLENIQFI